MRRIGIAVVCIALAAASVLAGTRAGLAEKRASPATTIAVMQGMDKVTARISTFDAPIGKTIRFGTLEIVVRICIKRPMEELPESAIYVEIRELRDGAAPVALFKGWMMASSPALSAMEHPVYDVWVIDCKNSSKSASGKSR